MPLSKNILTWCLLQFFENQIFIYRSSHFRELIAIMQIINKLGNHVSVVEWADTYGIHHWWILWSSYRKLAWVGFEPTTSEFRSDALTDWAIRLWLQLTLRANFVHLFQFHRLFSVTFHFGCLPLSVARFILIEVVCR